MSGLEEIYAILSIVTLEEIFAENFFDIPLYPNPSILFGCHSFVINKSITDSTEQ
jgi:hypothetical protein